MEPVQDDTVLIETTFTASIEKVWKAWTDGDLILKWFGSDPAGKGLKAELDVHTGGRFEVSFADSDGTEHTCRGAYVDVQRFNKLTFTWEWKNEPGVESFVSVILTPQLNHTRMQFQHARVGTASKHNYLQGWTTTFKKLERVLMEQQS